MDCAVAEEEPVWAWRKDGTALTGSLDNLEDGLRIVAEMAAIIERDFERIGLDRLRFGKDRILVSTVYLWEPYRPNLYETLVFVGLKREGFWRRHYPTREKAATGHAETVARLRAAYAKQARLTSIRTAYRQRHRAARKENNPT